ncbi:MAG TPA: M43 family zinc metalloprotease [Chitinophagales bacterium]|nr:choice-of-anchor J domain-containing protein [Chitinophagales bacterium]HMX04582.1 M43 family zinc metalloprotease [Chitinophagales bacterium]HMZ90339.1 M43 family zinc metalloprotease [Chitinophagales bacterium]HNI55650.1 M43 family zinc metalloprotease [Chitinophagales bacterium]HNM30916.1 M43 family zinc metalloprotease [Chitinophagales bacterium]
MRKFILLLIVLGFVGFQAQAQVNRCGVMEHEAVLQAKYPDYATKQAAREQMTQKIIQKMQANGKMEGGATIVTIPVVFHVVYKTAAQNIPDARLLEQIDILNEDFRRLNDDAANTPAAFTGVAADFEIEFCLASIDPNGNPTTGINRIETTVSSFGTDDNVKFAADGGANAWPADSYLNFWVCNLGASLLGYAQFPGGPANTDGVVIHYNHVGNNAAGYPYHLGRTATHEIGHWLDLRHIWGDDTNCAGSDLCGDTPNQKVETYGCPGYPKTDACSATSPGIMFMNYMDYTDDDCMNMFTEDQKSRARALFEPGGDRYGLLFSEGCGLQPFDAQAISSLPGGTVCNLSFTPAVEIKNHGTETLTSIDIIYSVDGGATSTFGWTGSIVTNATELVYLPSLTTTEGEHTLEVTLENPNGNTDADASDNITSTDFLVNLGSSMLPMVQGFEASGFPYTDYTLYNPDGGEGWERTNFGASIGTYSIFLNHFNNSNFGDIDEFVLPAYDMSDLDEVHFTFDVAYALYTASGVYSDTLEVLVSDDCGDSWTTLYKKANPDLQTAPPHTITFKPEDDEWRQESIDLSAYLGQPQVFVKFRTITNYENNLYVDNININDGTLPQAIDDLANDFALSLFPNPTSNNITVRFNTPIAGAYSVIVYNVTGALVYTSNTNASNGVNLISVPAEGLGAGLYHVQVSNGVLVSGDYFIKE